MTKRLLFVVVSSAALLAAALPAIADPNVPTIADGFISIAGGGSTTTFDDDPEDNLHGISLEGAASGEYNFSANLGFQGDLVLRSQDFEFDDDPGFGSTHRSLDTAIHAFYRQQNMYLLGAFAQYGTDTLGSLGGTGFAETFDRFYGGAEGQVFFGDFTLYGQAGGEQLRAEGESFNGYFANLEARYFLTPDLKLDAHIGGEQVDFGDDDIQTGLKLGVGAEYKLPDKPFSIFAKYDFVQTTFNGSSSHQNDNRFLIGAKFNFGTQTLEDRDRSGASLKPVESMTFGSLGEAE